MSFETISVIGLGYIGLPTAAVFASNNIKVIGVDVNQHAVDTINRGKIHIVEPNLDTVVNTAVKQGYLKASTQPEPADAFLIAVPTPFKDTINHEPDLSYIEAASRAIAPVLKKGDLVILESTVPVGSTEQMAGWLAEERPDLSFPQTAGEASDIRIAHCPERVLPGKILVELVKNDRVIGGLTPKCTDAAIALYKLVVEGECVSTNARTAEMCKLTENSFRDVNIAFANELSMICDKLDINVWELIRLANRHPRVDILQPGPGVGGHCIAVDPWFIINKSENNAKLIEAARGVNLFKSKWVVNKIKNFFLNETAETKSNIHEKKLMVFYGVSFKANVDDVRGSPAVEIIKELMSASLNCEFYTVDPNVKKNQDGLGEMVRKIELDKAIGLDATHVFLVKHREFVERFSEINKGLVIDMCSISSEAKFGGLRR